MRLAAELRGEHISCFENLDDQTLMGFLRGTLGQPETTHLREVKSGPTAETPGATMPTISTKRQ